MGGVYQRFTGHNLYAYIVVTLAPLDLHEDGGVVALAPSTNKLS